MITSATELSTTTTANSKVSEFMVTTQAYTELDDHSAACVAEFGAGTRKADWDTDLGDLTDLDIDALIRQMGVEPNGQSHWVFNGVQDQQYFVQRLDGNPPTHWVPWVVHDVHGDISLGSWYGIIRTSAISLPVLCVEPGKDGAASDAFTTTQATMDDASRSGPARRVDEVLSSGAATIASMCAPVVALLVSQVVLN